MNLLDFLKKANSTLTDVNDTLDAVSKIMGLDDENSDNQQPETSCAKSTKQTKIEKAIPAPKLFDKDGRVIPPDLRVR